MIELVSDLALWVGLISLVCGIMLFASGTCRFVCSVDFIGSCAAVCLGITLLVMVLMSPVHTDEYAICDIDYSDGILFVDGCNDSVAYNTQDTSIIKAAFTAKPGDLVMLKIRDRPFGLQSELMSMEVATR